MNEKDLTPFEQEMIEFRKEMSEFRKEMSEFRKETAQRLDTIETDIREIRSHISRIDANVEIMATSQGYPYSHKERRVYEFGRKVS